MKKTSLLLLIVLTRLMVYSQEADSIRTQVSGAVSLTNNGISLVPAFSLEKPALLFDLAVKRKRFSFEPQLAFGVEDAKPWYFVFWLRYKLVEARKFKLDLGVHPGFLFSTIRLPENGVSKEYFTTSRFFVGALTPTYTITPNISVGAYYQHARGYNSDIRQSDFAGLNLNFSDIPLGARYYLKAVPQVYYLKNDDQDGYYLNTNVSAHKRDFPFSVSALLNKKLRSEIPSDDFLWNLTVSWSF